MIHDVSAPYWLDEWEGEEVFHFKFPFPKRDPVTNRYPEERKYLVPKRLFDLNEDGSIRFRLKEKSGYRMYLDFGSHPCFMLSPVESFPAGNHRTYCTGFGSDFVKAVTGMSRCTTETELKGNTEHWIEGHVTTFRLNFEYRPDLNKRKELKSDASSIGTDFKSEEKVPLEKLPTLDFAPFKSVLIPKVDSSSFSYECGNTEHEFINYFDMGFYADIVKAFSAPDASEQLKLAVSELQTAIDRKRDFGNKLEEAVKMVLKDRFGDITSREIEVRERLSRAKTIKEDAQNKLDEAKEIIAKAEKESKKEHARLQSELDERKAELEKRKAELEEKGRKFLADAEEKAKAIVEKAEKTVELLADTKCQETKMKLGSALIELAASKAENLVRKEFKDERVASLTAENKALREELIRLAEIKATVCASEADAAYSKARSDEAKAEKAKAESKK